MQVYIDIDYTDTGAHTHTHTHMLLKHILKNIEMIKHTQYIYIYIYIYIVHTHTYLGYIDAILFLEKFVFEQIVYDKFLIEQFCF